MTNIGSSLPVKLDGVREYAEGYPVEIRTDDETGRLVVRAINEGGHNITEIDLEDLLDWLRRNSDAFGGYLMRDPGQPSQVRE